MRPPVVNSKSVAGRPPFGVAAQRIADEAPTWFPMDARAEALHQTPIEGHSSG